MRRATVGAWLLAALGAAGCRIRFDESGLRVDGAPGDAALDTVPPGWSHVIAGDQTTCGVYLGRAYCWGRGTNREIGDGMALDRPVPTAVALPAGTVTELAQGEGHGCAIVDGIAYCWGNAPPGNGAPMSAMPVQAILPTPVTSIGCGESFTCAVAAGDVYCWGVDTGGALGNGASTMTLPTPTGVSLPGSALSVDAGNDHAFALLAGGTVWGWGHNDSGALGTGSMTPANHEVPVQSLISGAQPRIAGWHACVVDTTGAASCWGLGSRGQLGDGLNASSASPVAVSGLDSGVTTIMTGGGPLSLDATCAVQAGETWCWGSDTFGRLGNGSTADESVPRRVDGIPADTVELALGYDHSCARSASGELRCWGRGDLGQLGDGNAANSLTPVLVPTP